MFARSHLAVLAVGFLCAPVAFAIGEERAPPTSACDAVPLAALGAPPPPIPGPCGGVRPGAQLGNGCTMNWVWEATTDGDRDLYVGTAGHCAFVGMVATTSAGQRFGAVVYARADGQGKDFALIHVDEESESAVNPALCHWGGPTRAFAISNLGDRAERGVLYYGNGVATFGDPRLKPREGAALSTDGSVSFLGTASGGDSGSPAMLRDGQAWGIITHTGPTAGVPPGVTTSGTSVSAAELYVRLALGLDLEIVPAPLA